MVDFPDRQIWQDFGELGFWLVGTINFYQNEMLTIGYRLQFFKVSIIQQRNDASAIFLSQCKYRLGFYRIASSNSPWIYIYSIQMDRPTILIKKLLNNQKGFYKNVLFNGVLYSKSYNSYLTAMTLSSSSSTRRIWKPTPIAKDI